MNEAELEWPASLSEKARTALAKRFIARYVTGDCDVEDRPFIGSSAIDVETSGANGNEILERVTVALNRLAEQDLIVGTRSPPILIGTPAGFRLRTRIMFAAGKRDAALAELGGLAWLPGEFRGDWA